MGTHLALVFEFIRAALLADLVNKSWVQTPHLGVLPQSTVKSCCTQPVVMYETAHL